MLTRIAEHSKWLADPSTGNRLDVRKEAISHDFTNDDLTGAILAHCDLTESKFGRCHWANFAFSIGGDFSTADVTDCTFHGSTFDGETLAGVNPIPPVKQTASTLSDATKAYLDSVKYLTCSKRGDPTGEEVVCGCNVDRVIYRCDVHGKCLKKLPSTMTRERFGEILNGVTICSECGGD